MIEPERWYEYQKNYQRYGFDMKPQPEREDEGRKGTEKRKRKIVIPVGNGRKVAFSMVLVVGIVMIALIIVTAYSANVRYDINSVIKENQELMGEIENLQVKALQRQQRGLHRRKGCGRAEDGISGCGKQGIYDGGRYTGVRDLPICSGRRHIIDFEE